MRNHKALFIPRIDDFRSFVSDAPVVDEALEELPDMFAELRADLEALRRHWVGGVVWIGGRRERGAATRIAAWVAQDGVVMAAALVEADDTAVLRMLLDEALLRSGPQRRPTALTVWPSARMALRDVVFPQVLVERDGILEEVVQDRVCAGIFPDRLPVRHA